MPRRVMSFEAFHRKIHRAVYRGDKAEVDRLILDRQRRLEEIAGEIDSLLYKLMNEELCAIGWAQIFTTSELRAIGRRRTRKRTPK